MPVRVDLRVPISNSCTRTCWNLWRAPSLSAASPLRQHPSSVCRDCTTKAMVNRRQIEAAASALSLYLSRLVGTDTERQRYMLGSCHGSPGLGRQYHSSMARTWCIDTKWSRWRRAASGRDRYPASAKDLIRIKATPNSLRQRDSPPVKSRPPVDSGGTLRLTCRTKKSDCQAEVDSKTKHR